MKRLVLHIGMHKTGTTSLQKALNNSQHLLNQYKIYYANLNKFDMSNSFYVAFLEDPTKHISFKNRQIHDLTTAQQMQERLKELWKKEFENFSEGCYIISDEELSYLSAESVARMSDFLKDHFNDITVIMYAREPSSFIPSIINEYIKYGLSDISKISFSRLPYYKTRLEKYVQVFGEENIIVRPFKKDLFKNNDLFQDFFVSLNLNFDASKIEKIVTNESLGYYALTVLLEYNKRYPRFIDGKINHERGLASYRINEFFELLRKTNDIEFSIELSFTQEEAEAINKEIDYINKFLSDEEKFPNIQPNTSENENSRKLDINNVPVEFFLDLINEYNKKIESLMNK